jgi:phage/plasmid-like protein (TIGR03299 family)
MHGFTESNHLLYAGDSNTWHGLGIYHPNGFGYQELVNSALNIEVEKSPAYNAEGGHQHGQYWLRDKKTRNVLSKQTVSEKFVILQNSDLFDFWHELLGKHNYVLETAGILGGGQDIWIQGKRKEGYEMEPVKGDPITKFLVTHNGFDGRTSLSVRNCAIRIVCRNTLMSAIAESGKAAVKIYHAQGIKEALMAIQNAIIHSEAKFADLEQSLIKLANKPIKYSSLEKFWGELFKKPYRDPNKLAADNDEVTDSKINGFIKKLFEAHEIEAESMAPSVRGSAYHVYNTTVRGPSHLISAKNLGTQLKNNQFGEMEGVRKRAMRELMTM